MFQLHIQICFYTIFRLYTADILITYVKYTYRGTVLKMTTYLQTQLRLPEFFLIGQWGLPCSSH